MRVNRISTKNKISSEADYTLDSTVRSLEKLYRELDVQTTAFKRLTGLRCASGCGRCCENPQVETTVLEFIPLAVRLHKKEEAEYWIKKATDSYLSGQCIFYQPNAGSPGKGSCLMYKFRPLLCRLFGFSATKDKYGNSRLITCPTIKKLYPKEYSESQKRIKQKLPVPIMNQCISKLYAIDFALGVRQMPINEAIKSALERIGLIIQTTQKAISIT